MTVDPLEAAQFDALAGRLMRPARDGAGHTAPPGSPCANCATPLQGPWCHACGQLGEDFHRSAWKLMAESIEGVLHLDGRLWRTLPDLVLRPARLTRAYLEGHRAPQIPPLRLFLVVLLAVFFTGALTTGGGKRGDIITVDHLTPAQRAELLAAEARAKAGHPLSAAERARLRADLKAAPNAAATADDIHFDMGPRLQPLSAWLEARVRYAANHPEELKLLMEQWSERFAFLMLPLAAGLMSLAFVFQRRFFLFDHLVFSMHSLSFLGLLISAIFLLQTLWGPFGLLGLAAPIHLFAHMRGVYRASVVGTLLRMALLLLGSLAGFALLMFGLVAVGLAGLNV
ncbi:MAG TPA: DUF3667 domain-containing protein [Caulobacteraceae bacterium]|jgi:hypothetical protein|nr:DUF3667 domain-containing protein [Caulobacteraceae bacterium]